jgi:hypothetical protein
MRPAPGRSILKLVPEEASNIPDNILLLFRQLRLIFRRGTDRGTEKFCLSGSCPKPSFNVKIAVAEKSLQGQRSKAQKRWVDQGASKRALIDDHCLGSGSRRTI